MRDPRSILWRRLEQTGCDAATLTRVADGWHVEGAAVFVEAQQPCRLSYQVSCDAAWRTTGATITGWFGDRPIEVALSADALRRWRLNDVVVPQVEGCIDVDLSFTPSTNLLPIRRLDLRPGEQATARAAWLRFPELSLEPLQQVYRRIDRHTYRYESPDLSFITQMVVDESGFVVSYPPLWKAEVETSCAHLAS